ncbi:MAG: hypothetical protein WDA75_15880 [Candidatus Latescibacterota bacterium]|jgi:hypothetical protein
MLHRQLRNALEEIFGVEFVAAALGQPELAQVVLYERPEDFKRAVLGFQRLNFREEHQVYVSRLERELGIALICSLLDQDTRELVVELGLNYL